jgi:hypothetical protein
MSNTLILNHLIIINTTDFGLRYSKADSHLLVIIKSWKEGLNCLGIKNYVYL